MVALTFVERTLHVGFESARGDVADVVSGVWAGQRDPFGLVSDARAAYAEFRRGLGLAGSAPLLTAPDAQPKLGKSAVPTFGLMLSPHTAVNGALRAGMAGSDSASMRAVNLCPMASAGCAAACLNTAGKGRMSTVQFARAVRTMFALSNPSAFFVLLSAEIAAAMRKHGEIRVRLNVVSDIRWEYIGAGSFLRMFGTAGMPMRFYDYTAWSVRLRPDSALTGNYSLTRSAKETHSVDDIRAMVASGANVAVPFAVKRGAALPEVWQGLPVIDGDASDDRTLDPRGVVVGLRAKGDAIGDASGFVRQP